DPRMPTICGLRRRGYTPSAIFDFVRRAGVAKNYSLLDMELLEHCAREELNMTALRRIAVIDPIKVVVTNYPEDKTEYFEISNNPNDENAGVRQVPFTRELYIDSSDFAEVPPPKFFRLKPEGEVRLMGSYIIKLDEIVKNEDGSIKELRCTADIETGTNKPDRKIKGTIHWVSAKYAQNVTVMMYDKLFNIENTGDIPEDKTYDDYLNINSVTKFENCKVEPALKDAGEAERFQFVRNGYFVKDTKNENTYNLIVGLKDSFKKG
ncbi:MAG: glutamine--tRNA ligase, partial [Clostridia bacterium]|nr:glutamine--tRNA ligase [Clostridia bacterium]